MSGPSGELNFPQQIKMMHHDLLTSANDMSDDQALPNFDVGLGFADGWTTNTVRLDKVLSAMLGTTTTSNGNPYAGQSIVNPSSDLAKMQASSDDFQDLIDGIGQHNEWLEMFDTVEGQVDKAFEVSDADNPFTGVSAFNPDVDLAKVQSDVEELRDLVFDIEPTSEWIDMVDAVLAKIDEIFKDPSLEIDNPYTGRQAYDPDGELDNTQSGMSSLVDIVDSMDPVSDWNRMITSVLAKIDDILGVNDFDARSRLALARSYNRIGASLFDINGVVGTAYPSGLAIMETEYNREVSDLERKRDADRAQIVMQGLSDMRGLLAIQVEGSTGSVREQTSVALQRINAKTAQIATDVGLDTGRADWRYKRASERIELVTRSVNEMLNLLNAQLGGASNVIQGQSASTAQRITSKMDEIRVSTNLEASAADWKFRRGRERAGFISQGVSDLTQLLSLRVQGTGAVAQSQYSSSVAAMTAKIEENQRGIALDYDDANWDLETLKGGAQVVGALAGVPVVPKGMTQLQSVISGLTAGAATGIQIGVATGNPGIGLLATVVGGIGGALSGNEGF